MMRTRHISGVTALAVLAASPLLRAQEGSDTAPRAGSYLVVVYVAETEGAIGYVSVGANVTGSDVKVLTVTAAAP